MSNKRQHILPQFYLKTFLTPGLVYRRGKHVPHIVPNPKKVAAKSYYFGKNIRQRKTIDKINSNIENRVAPIFRNLISNPRGIKSTDWIALSFLFANLFVRSSATIEEMRTTHLSFVDQVNTMSNRMMESLQKSLSEGKDISTFIDNSSLYDGPRFTLEQMNNEANIMRMKKSQLFVAEGLYSVIPSISECIRKMTFVILEAPRQSFFLTSDRPLSLQSRLTASRVGAGWENNDALGLISLCPSHALFMLYHNTPSIRSKMATIEEVSLFNRDIIRFAYEEVYSPFEYSDAFDWARGIDILKKKNPFS